MVSPDVGPVGGPHAIVWKDMYADDLHGDLAFTVCFGENAKLWASTLAKRPNSVLPES